MKKAIRWFFKFAKQKIQDSDLLRSLLYDEDNISQFANLDYQEVMLADKARLDAYKEAIQVAVKPGDVVIDLGTGTGILAMFAARSGAEKIYAVEHGSVIELAKRVASHNEISNIDFVQQNSRDFSIPDKVDLVIHEQIGSYLFDENMVENLLDLKARLLKPGGKILPARFQLFLEPVSLREDHRVPYCWEQTVYGIDYSILKTESIDNNYRQGNDRRYVDTGCIDHYLCKPEPLLECDLNSMNSIADIPTSFRLSKTVVEDGCIDGVSLYFKAIMDDVSFDNALDSPNTNWTNPLFRIQSRVVKKGDVLELSLDMGNILDAITWVVELN